MSGDRYRVVTINSMEESTLIVVAKHKHDNNGGSTEYSVVIGNEIVWFRDYLCSCGNTVKRDIIRREKI